MTDLRYLKLDDTVYRYVLANTLREHPEQTALRVATRSLPHAGMQISPEQGQFMALLAQLIGARRAIEVGVRVDMVLLPFSDGVTLARKR